MQYLYTLFSQQARSLGIIAAGALGVLTACGKDEQSPTSPSGTGAEA